jgi:hypothetical protein
LCPTYLGLGAQQKGAANGTGDAITGAGKMVKCGSPGAAFRPLANITQIERLR